LDDKKSAVAEGPTAPAPAPAASNNTSEEADTSGNSTSQQNRFREGDRRRIERWRREGTTGPNNFNSSSAENAADSEEVLDGPGADQEGRGNSISTTESDVADGKGPVTTASADDSEAKSMNSTASASGDVKPNNGTTRLATASEGATSKSLSPTNSTGNWTASPADPLALPTKVSLKSAVTACKNGSLRRTAIAWTGKIDLSLYMIIFVHSRCTRNSLLWH
jgi:hypothetical protein